MGELVDGMDDSQLYHYFSEFGFVVSAFRIPDQVAEKLCEALCNFYFPGRSEAEFWLRRV